MDVLVKFVPVLSDRKLLVVVDWNVDLSSANWFISWVVELSAIGMFQGLFSRQPLVGVKMQETLQEIKCIV